MYNGNILLRDGVTLLGAGADSCVIEGDVYAWGIEDAAISGFTITDNSTAGIHSYRSSLTITNNVVRDQPHNGIHSSRSKLDVRNNLFLRNGHNGIVLLDSSHAVVRNNIMMRNGLTGIHSAHPAMLDADYNDVWQNTEGEYGEDIDPGTHAISADPLFENEMAGNYHLQSTSPCIDAGDSDPAWNDLDGSRNDIGVFGGPGGAATGTSSYSGPAEPQPHGIVMQENYPNPFSANTHFGIRIAGRHWITVTIHDMAGRRTRTIYDGIADAGFHLLTWDGRDSAGHPLPAGVYVCRLRVGAKSRQRTTVLLR